VTPLSTRAAVAFFGVFGYELDPTTLTEAERAEIADQITFYGRHRELFQRGRFLRLVSPFENDGHRVAWMVVADDRRRAVVGSYRILGRPDPGPERLRLRGLDPEERYTVTSWPAVDDRLARANAGERSGAELMAAGLVLDLERWETAARGDFWARLFVLEAASPGPGSP
jgi:alpha-galactosidase